VCRAGRRRPRAALSAWLRRLADRWCTLRKKDTHVATPSARSRGSSFCILPTCGCVRRGAGRAARAWRSSRSHPLGRDLRRHHRRDRRPGPPTPPRIGPLRDRRQLPNAPPPRRHQRPPTRHHQRSGGVRNSRDHTWGIPVIVDTKSDQVRWFAGMTDAGAKRSHSRAREDPLLTCRGTPHLSSAAIPYARRASLGSCCR
jgi:hypothetical protein